MLELLVFLHVSLLVSLKVTKNSGELLQLVVELFLFISHFFNFFTVVIEAHPGEVVSLRLSIR